MIHSNSGPILNRFLYTAIVMVDTRQSRFLTFCSDPSVFSDLFANQAKII